MDNAVRCEANIGSSFNACGYSCPSGYHVASRFCNYSCPGDCFSSDNAVRCDRG
jgi:hypothetical protein